MLKTVSKKNQETTSETPTTKALPKPLLIAALAPLLLLVLLLIIPLFFDSNALKFAAENKVNNSLNGRFSINGKVRATFLPSPSIILSDVLLQGYVNDEKTYNFYAKTVQIKASFAAIFGGKFIPKKIIFSDAILESFYNLNQPINRSNSLITAANKIAEAQNTAPQKSNSSSGSSYFSLEEINLSSANLNNLPTIVIENGETFFYNQQAKENRTSNINIKTAITNQKIAAEGNFIKDTSVNNLKLLIKLGSSAKSPDSYIELSSNVVDLKLTGVFSSNNSKILLNDFKGNITAEIFDLKSFYKNYVDDNAIYQKLKSGDSSIKISADIINNAGEAAISNIKIDSNLISGAGDAVIDFTSTTPTIDVNLNLDNLDLDNIWSKERIAQSGVTTTQNNQETVNKDEATETNIKQPAEAVQAVQIFDPNSDPKNNPQPANSTTQIINPTQTPKDKNKDFDLNAEVKIKNVKYLSGEIQDVNLYFNISQRNKVLILPLIFNIPGQGILRANGLFDNSSTPKFIGKFDASGKNLGDILKWLKIESQNLKYDSLKEYIIYSDITLLPNSISMNNFYLNLNNNQSEFLGNIAIDNNEKIPSVVNKFRITSFNVNDYFLVSGQNVYLSSGSLLKKIFWLNDLSSNDDLTLYFDKLIYNGEEFRDQTLKLRYGQGYLEINNLILKSENKNLNASLTIDISKSDPKFDINITAEKFNYNSPIYEAPKAEAAETKEVEQKPKPKINIIDQFYALPSLEGFNGKVSLVVGEAAFDGTSVTNAKVTGDLKDGIINLTEMNCDIYGGRLDYKGTLGIKITKIINGNFTHNNVNLGQLFSDLFDVKSLDGIANISASISSSAATKDKFKNSLTSEIKFNAGAVEVKGYGLVDLIKKMFAYKENFEDLKTPEKILFNSQSSTTLKQASGILAFKNSAEGKFKINIVAPVTNGIVSGKFDINSNKVEGFANVIFLTGNRQKQTPINIASNFKGNISNPSQSSNVEQIKQYLGISKTVLIQKAPPTKEGATSADQASNPEPNQQNSEDAAAIDEIKRAMSDPQNYKISPEFQKKQQEILKKIEEQEKQAQQQNQNNDPAKLNQ